MPLVDLEDDAVGQVQPGLVVAHGAARDQKAVGQDRGDLDDGHVQVAVEPEPHLLRQVRQVDVRVLDLAGVDLLPQGGVRDERGALRDAVHPCQLAVDLLARGRAGQQRDPEVLAAVVRRLDPIRQGGGDGLGVAGSGEPAHAHGVTGADVGRRLLCGGNFRSQNRVGDARHARILSARVQDDESPADPEGPSTCSMPC
jgi:hypothetical protein